MNIQFKPSPNFRIGRGGYKAIAIVVHIMVGSLPGTDNWFNQSRSHVSSHYGVGKNGDVHKYVEEVNTAFHCGIVDSPSWQLIKQDASGNYINPNLYTIGIEHEGMPGDTLTTLQANTSAQLIADIALRNNIPLDALHVIGHHEIRAGKTCPDTISASVLLELATGYEGKVAV